MSLRQLCQMGLLVVCIVVCIACGQVYRPVVIPLSINPPNPANFHNVFSVNANIPSNPGTGMQIDVSGDTNIGEIGVGLNPTHAAILPNNSRVFVASAGSVVGQADLVSSFTPAFPSTLATGLTASTSFSLPAGSQPVFVHSTDNNNMYVANFGTNAVAAISTSFEVVNSIVSVGVNPVALAETPDGRNLYVVNQGDNTVTDLFPTDMSTLAVIPVGSAPVWATTRVDGQRLYVITQGDGNLYTIDTTTNSVISTQSVGSAGANFLLYDKSRNRLYVTNPTAGAVFVFSAATDPPTPLGSASGIRIAATPACPTSTCPVMPVSVAALPDASRFYVASYQVATPCPDPNVTAPRCVIPQVTVFDAGSLAVKTTVFPLLPALTAPSSGVQPFAVAAVSSCDPVVPYAPGQARFRLFAVAATDSSRAYVSVCDAGAIAIINTTTSSITAGGSNTPDTLITDMTAPFGAGNAGSNGEPPPQNPIFLLRGQ